MRPEDLLARLEAGYEYDPMYGRLCNERDQLKAENAKLREQVDAAHISRLLTENENEKLRELVEDMLDCIDIQIAFERVPARWMQDEFTGRARELGIEVDE